MEKSKIIEKLKELYSEISKHSQYQMLPKSISNFLGDMKIVKPRYEEERLEFILKNIDVKDKKVLDIGGNTGFFTFELLNAGAKKITYYEGNQSHAEFVELAKILLGYSNKIEIHKKYFNFKEELSNVYYDITLLLNVLHHIGDDFEEEIRDIDSAKEGIIKHLNYLAKNTNYLVFQMGFNWKGNIKCCLFEKGTKLEMIEFIFHGLKNHWEIINIGIPEKIEGKIYYKELNENNIKRDDSLGEFLNRPLFIFRSKYHENFSLEKEKIFVENKASEYDKIGTLYSKIKHEIIYSEIEKYLEKPDNKYVYS